MLENRITRCVAALSHHSAANADPGKVRNEEGAVSTIEFLLIINRKTKGNSSTVEESSTAKSIHE